MTPAAAPWPALAALATAVLAVHLIALDKAPAAFSLRHPTQAAALSMRTLEAPPAPAAIVAAPGTAPAAALKPKQPKPRVGRSLSAIDSIAEPVQIDAAAAVEPGIPDAAAEAASTNEATAPALRERAVQAQAFSVAAPVLLRYQATARARGFTVGGKATLAWRHDGSSYDARLEISATLLPSRVQRSSGRLTAQGLEPDRFSDKSRNEEATHFERGSGRLVFSNNRPDAPLLAGAQDRLSVLLQLAAMVAGAPAQFPPATTISVQTASTREADVWLFTVQAQEELQLPGGNVQAIKLVRNPRREFDQSVELWLAPGMDYAPARLRLTQANGDWLDLQWSGTDTL